MSDIILLANIVHCRFLVATWMSGHERKSPGKALLCRMIPTGLTEHLKHTAITEEHRKNLDEMEDDFYSAFAAATSAKAKKSGNDKQLRMRMRIAGVLKVQRQCALQIGSLCAFFSACISGFGECVFLRDARSCTY